MSLASMSQVFAISANYGKCSSRFLVLSHPPPYSNVGKTTLVESEDVSTTLNQGGRGKHVSIVVMFTVSFLSALYLSKIVAYLNKYSSGFNFA